MRLIPMLALLYLLSFLDSKSPTISTCDHNTKPAQGATSATQRSKAYKRTSA